MLQASSSTLPDERSFNLLARGGDKFGSETFGLLTDIDGNGIVVDGEPLVSPGAGAHRSVRARGLPDLAAACVHRHSAECAAMR